MVVPQYYGSTVKYYSLVNIDRKMCNSYWLQRKSYLDIEDYNQKAENSLANMNFVGFICRKIKLSKNPKNSTYI